MSKNQSRNDIQDLISQGFKIFGENRVQEAKKKFDNINNLEKIKLHLIGPLQTNKVKDALKTFNTIQTIDRKKLIDEIAKVSLSLENRRTNSYFIQVNIGSENQKAGVDQADVGDLYHYAVNKGLNIIPDDQCCKLYIERCQDYISEPPPEDWDGVFIMKTK